jgi:nitrate reductase NapD
VVRNLLRALPSLMHAWLSGSCIASHARMPVSNRRSSLHRASADRRCLASARHVALDAATASRSVPPARSRLRRVLPMSEAMLHIASAVVKARPAAQDMLVERIAALAGAEVLTADHGRIIVILEASRHRALADTLDCIAGMDGVMSATLVFEHSEPEGEVT